MTVAVVTDSTADLPADLVAEHAVRIVPLRIAIDARSAIDGVDIGPDEVVEALRAKRAVSTSRPSPGDFVLAYRQALEAGADHVVSVHLSAELSGTWDSARLAAQEFGYGIVRVVDSRSTSMALGFAVMAAARAAAAGASAGEVQDAAVAAADRTSCLFYVDTLEYLRRGGRIGAAAAMLGTALSVKPLLHVRDGRIVPLEKVRTSSRALARLVALTVQAAGADPVDIGVQHLAAKDRADKVAERLREQLPSVRQLITAEVSATVGAHTGPGVVGVAVARY
jgi:fatty acid kinase fatty acid binding subunit